MKILVLNAGSSSQKCGLYDVTQPRSPEPLPPIWEGQLDWHDSTTATLSVQTDAGAQLERELAEVTRGDALQELLKTLWQGETQVIQDLRDIDGVGHRVVHGGQAYHTPVLITDAVKAAIADLSVLAPAHNPVNLEGIEQVESLLGDVPQVAVFDTAFHQPLSEVAYTYPGCYEWLAQGIRRYGFHGISHDYCSQRTAQLLGQHLTELRLISCHLGNGCSLAAVKEGQSIDTTMGFTPLDGVMMGTRSGAVDPGILIHLLRHGYDADRLDQLLNRESGLKGISGISHDWRVIAAAIAQGNRRAQLAQDLYLHRLKAGIGAMLMSLGGLDALVFTGGIGEHVPHVREAICAALAFLGLRLDLALNQSHPVDQDIATPDSTVRVLVIRTQEDWAIAQASWHCLQTLSR